MRVVGPIVYKQSSSTDFGTADREVDGTVVKSYNGSDGWNNPITDVVIAPGTAASHTVKVRMHGGYETKQFSILAFGYAE